MLYNPDYPDAPSAPPCRLFNQRSFPQFPRPVGIVCVGYNLITTAFPFSVCVCVWCVFVCLCVCELQSRCCRRADATKYAHLYLHEYCQLQRIIPPRTATKHFRHHNPNPEPNPTSTRLPPLAGTARGQWNIFGSCRQRLRLENLLLPNAYLSHLQCAWRQRRHSTIYKQLGSSGTAAAVAATARRGSGHQ